MSILDDVINMTVDIDEFLEAQTEAAIQERMFGRVDPELDTSPGNYIWDSINPTSYEHALLYMAMRYALHLAVPQRSFGGILSLHSAAHGSPRKDAVAATGSIHITGSAGTTIPVGTKFSTTVPNGSDESPKYFSTVKVAVLPENGTADIPIQADKSGATENVRAGEINLNIGKLGGISSVTNTSPLENGVDAETDPDLLVRMLERVQNPPSSGNKADYKRWAKEVAGVGDAIIQSLWDGPGTVKVITIGTDGGPVSADVIAAAQAYIDPGKTGKGDGKAPVGAHVTVDTVEGIPIRVTVAAIELEAGYGIADVKPLIVKRVRAYIESVAPGGVIRLKEIEAKITETTGVLDFNHVLLNDDTGNLELAEEEKATLGEVVFE